MINRRDFLYQTLLSSIGISMLACNGSPKKDMSGDELNEYVRELHKNIISIDSHCDTPLPIHYRDLDIGVKNDPYKNGSKVDLIRMKKGMLDASFFAVFIGQGKRNEESNKIAYNKAIDIFKTIETEVAKYPDLAVIATEPQDIFEIKKHNKRAIYIGVENGYPIGNDIKNIETFYNKGARYITLCHTKNNDICDSSTDDNGAEHNGVSAFGEQVIQEMNRMGIMVDVSHISDKSYYDVIELSKTPVIASHSSSREICNHPRNFNDKMLLKLKENGGVIQLCILNRYIKTPPENPERDSAFAALRKKYNNFSELSEEDRKRASAEWNQINVDFPEKLASVSDAVDHIDHIVKVAGIDHVGIGTDFDGGGGLKDCYDVSELNNITKELVKRGYTDKEIEKIWGKNFLRVFNEVVKYSNT